jgi:hypothetical protein
MNGRVAPFGHLRINACLRLPEAFRSLPRPSSPVGAKASIIRPEQLDRHKNYDSGSFRFKTDVCFFHRRSPTRPRLDTDRICPRHDVNRGGLALACAIVKERTG